MAFSSGCTPILHRRIALKRSEAPATHMGSIRMSGRVMQDHPGWLAMLADCLQLPVLPVVIKRATLHGTALLALDTIAPDVERADPTIGRRFEPVPENAAYYAEHRARFEEQYGKLVQ